MLDAISNANRSITIEAYIYWAGSIGEEFAQALAAKARGGGAGQDPARRRRIVVDRRRDPGNARRRRVPARVVQPAATGTASAASTTGRIASR